MLLGGFHELRSHREPSTANSHYHRGMLDHPAIQAKSLVKRFGELTAVDGIDLAVQRGQCLGVLGPNGAGKTTTIEMLEGLTPPDEGQIEILGLSWDAEARSIRGRIGVQLQETQLLDKLTVRETLRMFASFYPNPRSVEELLEIVSLEDKQAARHVTLSGGQKQRLTLACALVGQPEILFLDEPTTGLDPQARRRVWEIVEAFKSNGGTVLLTTHYMDEADRLADGLVVMDGGKVIAEGTPNSLIAALEADSIVELQVNPDTPVDPADLQELPGVLTAKAEGTILTLSVTNSQVSLGEILHFLRTHGITLDALHTHRPTLEDVFVNMTGRHLRDT